jgi:hypothetical protein
MFVSQPPVLGVVISPLMFAGLRLASYIRRNFPQRLAFIVPVCDRVLAKKVGF